MKRKIFFPMVIFCALTAVSCIKEGLEPCPSGAGPVTITVRAEKFRTRPPYKPEDMEEEFATRIRSLAYFLYSGSRLVEQGVLSGTKQVDDGTYVFRHDPLPFGDYRIAFVANAESEIMTGDTGAPESYYFPYDRNNTDDHFRAASYFDVTCPVRNEYDVVLRRVYGVTHFNLLEIPADITAVEVILDNVGARMPVSGDPDQSCSVIGRVAVSSLANRSSGSFILGTFCTLPGTKTSWRMKLYGEDATKPVYDRVLRNDLYIESNQLIELTADLSRWNADGDIDVSVDMDPTWDGSNSGVGDEIIVDFF